MQYYSTREEFGLPALAETVPVRYISTASYSDEVTKQAILQTGKVELLYQIASQLAVVGWARGALGRVAVSDTEEREISEVFDELGVHYDNTAGAALELDVLTPRRIVRFFRFEIRKNLKEKGTSTFLSRKYSNRADRAHKHILFPCAEYLELTPEESVALLNAYAKMDEKLGTQFRERAERVMLAISA